MTARTITLADLAEPEPEHSPGRWGDDGVVVLHGLIPDDVIDAYSHRFKLDAEQRSHRAGTSIDQERARGYGIGTPYLANAEMRDLCLHGALTEALTWLRDETMGLHLNLSGWKSTQRAWHVDSYLSPPYVGMKYAAAWIALDDIHPDSGPFEYIPGSHRWPAPTQAKVLAAMGEDGADPDWPWRSEALLGPLYDREIINRGAHIQRFIAKKGDVLLWSANTVHRGSVPVDPMLERHTLIAHYSELTCRKDMAGTERKWKNGAADGWFFALGAVH